MSSEEVSRVSATITSTVQRAQKALDSVGGSIGDPVQDQEREDFAAVQLRVEILRVRHLRECIELERRHQSEQSVEEREHLKLFAKKIQKVRPGH
jgi:hypothetical protein